MTYHDDHRDINSDYEPLTSNQSNTEENESYPHQQLENNIQEENKRNITKIANEPDKRKKGDSNPSNRLAMFISGITGGLVVAGIGFLLIFSGILPTDTNNQNETAEIASTPVSKDTSSNVIQTIASDESSSLTNALQKVADSVVGVSNIRQAGLWTQSQEAGTGSGVIYKKEDGKAYVVTNNHVVEGATEVEVILTDGEHVSAEVLGADQLTDLAVLVLDGSKVTQVATLGSSDNLAVGETAIAIGNPLGTEFAGSVTKGIISGLERSVEMDINQDGQADWTTEVIQTDAAINPGNSGGALINNHGEVIGINSMKIAQASVEGIGFAIPIDSAKPIIEQLETNGQVARPFMGISAVSLSTVPTMHKQETLKLESDVTNGIVIAEVQPNSPSDQAGLERYDVITKVNGQDIASMMDLKELLYSETTIGDKIEISYFRAGQQQSTTLTLSEQS